MDDKSESLSLVKVNAPYATVISYLNCKEEYEFNNFSFRNYLGSKISGSKKLRIKDVVGKNVYSVIKPYLDKALSGEEQQFEFEWKPSDDKTSSLFKVNYIPDIGDDGHVKGIHIISSDVSAEIQQRLLEESEERLQQVMDATGDGVWDWNIKTGEVIFSQKWCQSLGYKPEEVGNDLKFWKQILHPDDEQGVVECIKAYFANKSESYSFENRLRNRSGEYRHNLARGRIIEWDSEGNPSRMVGTDTDITEVKKARLSHLQFLQNLKRIDKVIQQSNDLEQMMSDVLQTALEIFDSDRVWLLYPCDPEAESWNVPMERTKPEFPGAHAIGKDVPMLPEVVSLTRETLDKNDVMIIQMHDENAPSKTAEEYSVQSQMHMPVHPKTGKAWIFGMHQCAHARIWNEDEINLFREIGHRLGDALSSLIHLRELQESEEHLRLCQLYGNIGTWEADLVNNRQIWSEMVTSQLGFPDIAEPTWENFIEVIDANDRDYVIEQTNHHIEQGTEYDIEYRIRDTDGNTRWMRSVGRAEYDTNGKPVIMRGTVRDITERKQKDLSLQESEARFRKLFEHTDAIAVQGYDQDRKVIFWNPASESLYGYSVAEAMGKQIEDLIIPEEMQDSVKSKINDWMNNNIAIPSSELTLRKSDDSPVQVFSSHVIFRNHSNEPEMYCIDIDLSELKQAEEELQKLSRAVEASSSSVMITNREGIMEYVNPKFSEVTGYSKEEAIGQNPRILQSGETPASTFVHMWETILAGNEWRGEFRNRRKDGSLSWERASVSGVQNKEGEITHFIAIQEDVTREYELTEKLNFQASHDALTGLINRREFERRVERLLSRVGKEQSEHALCYMDLDQFKVINDTCGHTAGDEMLRQLSQILKREVRRRDTIARLGGDEFAVLMEHCSLTQARRVAKSMQEAIQNFQFSWEGHSFRVGASIGLVGITEDISNITELLKQADAACYMAKDFGRNRIHVYQPEDSATTRRHGEMQWVERIYQALEDNRFCLAAQSIEPLNEKQAVHYELLLRMEEENGDLIPPGIFLPAAERYNLAAKIDRWVVSHAFCLLAENPGFLDKIEFVSINLSGQSLADDAFLEYVIQQLQETEVESSKICFEITETAAISHLGRADQLIARLRQFGCSFALDDFGSGLSSFGYLKQLPVDYLKIDGMFVKDIVADQIDHAMVKSINEIGQVMGMETIAEFVETDEIKGMLREIGVNYAQGYAIGKPVAFIDLVVN